MTKHLDGLFESPSCEVLLGYEVEQFGRRRVRDEEVPSLRQGLLALDPLLKRENSYLFFSIGKPKWALLPVSSGLAPGSGWS